MNIAEILRGLADKMDGISQQDTHQAQSAQLHQVDAEHEENPDVNTDSMVSPLQQKLELLKKAAGVESAYDEEGGCEECGAEPCECDDESDPLSVMKRNAGLPAMVVQMSGEDNDIEG
jgi:hypothetical protein